MAGDMLRGTRHGRRQHSTKTPRVQLRKVLSEIIVSELRRRRRRRVALQRTVRTRTHARSISELFETNNLDGVLLARVRASNYNTVALGVWCESLRTERSGADEC